MKIKKSVVISLALLLMATLLSGCDSDAVQPQKGLDTLLRLLESDDIDSLTLTIYYMDPYASTRTPISADQLMYGMAAVNAPAKALDDANGLYEEKIVVDGIRLKEHIDLFGQIERTALTAMEDELLINARIHYIFATEKDGKILEVTLWAAYNSIIVNGVGIIENSVFYDIIMPFLPANAADTLESYTR